MRTIAVVSLGCAKNLVDTEIMLGQLLGDRWELTRDFSRAEFILVNTCGFIASAKEESIQTILEMSRYKEAGVGVCRRLVVAGCLVQRYAAELSHQIPEVDQWIGLGQLAAIRELIANEGMPAIATAGTPFLNDENLPRFRVTLGHTAYLKIAEGCDHRCSYCAIPIIKGGFRSRRPEAIIREAGELARSGVREINLIAQDITMYGRDLEPRLDLLGLLKELLSVTRPAWLRLLYAYPSGITPALLEWMAAEPLVCNYLDLPLQHIHPHILRQMNRPDKPEAIREKLTLIRTVIPDITLRSTFIVGFPGETDVEFETLRSFVAEGLFQHVGVFAYSREEGTAAYQIRGHLPKRVKERRRGILMAEQQRVSRRFLARYVGREEKVLVDRVLPDGYGIGRGMAFAPEIDGVIYIKNYRGPVGDFANVVITGHDDYNLQAEESFTG